MPSSHERAPANSGRRARAGSPDDAVEKLRDELKNAYTELNKVTSERDRCRRLHDQAAAERDRFRRLCDDVGAERDRYRRLHDQAASDRDRFRRLYDQAAKKLSESQAEKQSLRAQAQAQTPRLRELEAANAQLARDNDGWHESYTELAAQYHRLAAALPAGAGRREERGGDARELRADKERLSRRFDEARGRRHSFVDGWAAGPRPAPGPRWAFADGAGPGAGAGGYTAGGADGVEDGNYHAHPVR